MSIYKAIRLWDISFQLNLWTFLRRITLSQKWCMKIILDLNSWIWIFEGRLIKQYVFSWLVISIYKPIHWLVILFKSFWWAYFIILSNWRFWWYNFLYWILLFWDIEHKIDLILKVFTYWFVIFLIEIDLYKSVYLRLGFINELIILNIMNFGIKSRCILILIIVSINWWI